MQELRYAQSTGSVSQLHQENPVCFRRLERCQILVPSVGTGLCCELQEFYAYELQTFGDVHEIERLV